MPNNLNIRMRENIKKRSQFVYEVLYASVNEYNVGRVSRMSAAVAYRTLFALAPLFIISVGMLGLILGSDAEAQQEIYHALEALTSAAIADAFETFLNTALAGSGSATAVGFILLLWTTSSLFYEVQNDLNDIFHVPYEQTSGAFEYFKKRGWGFLWAIGIGLLVLSVWLVNITWQYFDGLFEDRDLDVLHTIVDALAPFVSMLLLPILFGLLYQSLTDVRIRNKSLLYGAVFVSLGFVVSAWAAGLYFAFTADTTAATVAASLFVLVLLAYILSGVFLFGAVVIKVHHDYLASGDVMAPTDRSEARLAEITAADVVVADPPTPVPVGAVSGFLAGLFVGWRRSRR